jgi:hypothetical protein
MSLFDKARQARTHANVCADPGCHALAAALESALDAAAREQLSELREPADLTGIPDPPVSSIRIPRGDTGQN